MVKIPGLDDLKKMGSNLIDSAKSVKLGEMVDKVKSGIESVGSKKNPADTVTNEVLKNAFQGIFTSLTELATVQNTQINAIKKIEKQIEELARLIETHQNPPVSETHNQENKLDE